METDLFQGDKVRQDDVLAIGPGSRYLRGFLVQDAIAVLQVIVIRQKIHSPESLGRPCRRSCLNARNWQQNWPDTATFSQLFA